MKARRSASSGAWLVVAACVAVFALACGTGTSVDGARESGGSASTGGAGGASARLRVVTTLFPLQYFASRIGGDQAEVVNILPPGVEAHDFQPTAADLRAIDAADVLIYNGAGFETWISRVLDALDMSRTVVVEAADIPGLRDGGDGGSSLPDPHVWLDPTLAAEQVQLIGDALARADPGAAETFHARAAKLARELMELDSWIRSRLSGCHRREFVTTHSGFAYLARRYGLEQIGITGISPDAEPRPSTLANIADRLKELGADYLFTEPGMNPRLAQTLASEVGAGILTLHPLESLLLKEQTRGETYFSLMRSNVEQLRLALGC